MSMIGSTIRSAQINAITPAKLIAPFQRTAASGILPTEQTNERTATNGPMSGPQNVVATGCDIRKKLFQKSGGTDVRCAQALSRQSALSFHTAAITLSKYCRI